MTRKIVVLILVLVFPTLSAAQSVWVGAFSKYMTQHGAVLYDKPVVQADITWNLPRGTYFDLWLDQSLDGQDNEIDYTLGWANQYVDASFAFYDLNPVGKSGDMFMSQVRVSRPWKKGSHTGSFFATGNYLAPRGEVAGTWFRIGFADSVPIGKNSALNQSGWVMRDGGAFSGPRGMIARYEASLALQRGKYSLQPAVTVSLPLGIERERQVIVGMRIAR